eukprot:419737-Amphidinium_carterae.1
MHQVHFEVKVTTEVMCKVCRHSDTSMAPTFAPYHQAEVSSQATSFDQFRHSGNHLEEHTGQIFVKTGVARQRAVMCLVKQVANINVDDLLPGVVLLYGVHAMKYFSRHVLHIAVIVNSITRALVDECFKLSRASCPGWMNYSNVAQACATYQETRLSLLVVSHYRHSGIWLTATNVAEIWLNQMASDAHKWGPWKLKQALHTNHHSASCPLLELQCMLALVRVAVAGGSAARLLDKASWGPSLAQETHPHFQSKIGNLNCSVSNHLSGIFAKCTSFRLSELEGRSPRTFPCGQ